MAIGTNNLITPADINAGFTNAVINTILSGAYDINNVPRDGIYECVPSNILGNKNTLPTPSVGRSGGLINAAELYNNLVAITTTLTRVGTFSYTRTYNTNGHISIQYQLSGKALYNETYVRSLAAVNNPDIVSGKLISASNLNSLFANLLIAWQQTTTKYHNSYTNNCCHSNCHSNCHSDCHNDCNCYK